MTVNPDFTFEPRALDFGEVPPGETKTGVIIFQPQALTQLKLMTTQHHVGPFEVSVKATSISVTFHGPHVTYREQYNHTLQVATSSPQTSE